MRQKAGAGSTASCVHMQPESEAQAPSEGVRQSCLPVAAGAAAKRKADGDADPKPKGRGKKK